MKGELLAIARSYMMRLFNDMNYSIHNFDITLNDFDAYESEHIEYVYGENNSVEVYRLLDGTLVQSYTEDVTEADEENNVFSVWQ